MQNYFNKTVFLFKFAPEKKKITNRMLKKSKYYVRYAVNFAFDSTIGIYIYIQPVLPYIKKEMQQ